VRPLLCSGVAALVLAVAVGCSSSSTGTSGPDPTSASTSASSPDKKAVDAILDEVVNGLETVSGVGADSSLTDAATALSDASTKLAHASQQLTPPPGSVPDAVAAPAATSLTRLSELLDQAATCLRTQAAAQTPDARKCLPPLRSAQQNDAAVSRELISLAAYGSRTPAAFERSLVQALRGTA
jgi:hypothetical protein